MTVRPADPAAGDGPGRVAGCAADREAASFSVYDPGQGNGGR